MLKKYFFSFLFLTISVSCFAQDDLLNLVNKDSLEKPKIEYVSATFKGTRVINGQSVETVKKGILQFMISHRFGTINSGGYNLFGLDNATIRLGFDYGVNDRFTIGLGRSSLEKTFDGNLKYKLLKQSNGIKKIPVTITLFTIAALNSLNDPLLEPEYSRRLSYTFQTIIARKFNKNFSLQLSPTFIHRNFIFNPEEKNDVYAIGLSGRHKLTKRVSLNAEYFYLLPSKTADLFYNSFSVGFDIETGGHVFQLHITNSHGMIEQFFIPQNNGSWLKGDIYFGFNVSRAFSLVKKRN